MAIRTVFFDVGDTLLKPAVPEAQVVVDAAASLGASVDLKLVEENIPRMYRRYEELYEQDSSLWADEERAVGIWLTIYEYLCELIGLHELAPDIARISHERFLDPDSWDVFDDVLSTLFALQSRRVTMGLISNWDKSLKNIIKGVGIEFYFRTIISSAEVRLHKPQPEIFELAVRESGAILCETLHVGDHITADAEGAARVGIRPVLLDRADRYEDSENYIRIQNLKELIRYL